MYILQEDLSLMTNENQSLSADLNDVVAERENFKSQVQDYVSEVKRVEDTLSEKVSNFNIRESVNGSLIEIFGVLTNQKVPCSLWQLMGYPYVLPSKICFAVLFSAE